MGRRHTLIEINASPSVVYGVFVDPTRWTEWQPTARNVVASGSLDAIGARVSADYQGPFHLDAEVTAVEPGVRHQMRVSELLGLVTCTMTTQVEPATNGTRLSVDYDYRVRGGPFGRLLDGFVGNMMVSESGRDLARLNAVAEREAAPR